MKLQKTLKLSWDNVAAMIALELCNLIGCKAQCVAVSDDTDYWCATVSGRMSAVEIAEILDRIKAPYETRIEAIPQDSKDTKSLGMDLSTRLLKRRLGIDWEDYFFNEGGMYIVLPEDSEAPPSGNSFRFGENWIDMGSLKTRQELMDYLGENGATHASLMEFCEAYMEKYHNDLCWPYPISDGRHMGTFLVLVREGVLSLPYDDVEKEAGEIFILSDVSMFDYESMESFRDSWKSYSDCMLTSMSEMMEYLRIREQTEVRNEADS